MTVIDSFYLQAKDCGTSDIHTILKQVLQDVTTVRESEEDIARDLVLMKVEKDHRPQLRRMLASTYENVACL